MYHHLNYLRVIFYRLPRYASSSSFPSYTSVPEQHTVACFNHTILHDVISLISFILRQTVGRYQHRHKLIYLGVKLRF